MNQVARIEETRLPLDARVAEKFGLSQTEWRVLTDQTFPSAKSAEAITMALAYCDRRNLDIFKKPVHIVPVWSTEKNRMVETVWPGIAEIRTTAARTGQYAGIDAVEFGPMIEREFSGEVKRNNNWETISKTVRFPEWASVVVYRITQGKRYAYHAKVFWEETYASIGKGGVPNDMWEKRARGQLEKCAEAAALRKAFPEELGSVYAAEEMEGRTIEGDAVAHADIPQERSKTPPPPPPVEDVIEDAEVVHETAPAPPTEQPAEQPQPEAGQKPADALKADDLPPLNDYEASIKKWKDDLQGADDLQILDEIWDAGPGEYLKVPDLIFPPDEDDLKKAYSDRAVELRDA